MEVARGADQGPSFRSVLIGSLVGLVLLVAPSGATAAAVPDAACPGPSDGTSFTPLGDRREAQTFIAGHTGALQRVTLEVNNLSAGNPDFLVQILATDANGSPTNTALASTTIPKASVPAGASTLDVGFSPGAVVSAGGIYAVTISRPGANFLIPTWRLGARAGDPCVGSSFLSLGQTFGWTPEPSGDIVYQTYVDPVQALTPGGGGSEAGFTLVNKHGRLYARVPGPGKLIVDDAKKKRHTKRRSAGLVKRTKARAKKAGDVLLRIELTNRAVRRALKRRKLNFLAAVTYTPTGGTPSTLTFRIRLRL
jgi:hypothetical protein